MPEEGKDVAAYASLMKRLDAAQKEASDARAAYELAKVGLRDFRAETMKRFGLRDIKELPEKLEEARKHLRDQVAKIEAEMAREKEEGHADQ